MKYFQLVILANFMSILFCKAQARYEVLADSAQNNEKMLKGIIDKNDLLGDTSFHWYAESQRIYPHPDTSAVAAFRNNKDSIYFPFLEAPGAWTHISCYLNFIKSRKQPGSLKIMLRYLPLTVI